MKDGCRSGTTGGYGGNKELMRLVIGGMGGFDSEKVARVLVGLGYDVGRCGSCGGGNVGRCSV